MVGLLLAALALSGCLGQSQSPADDLLPGNRSNTSGTPDDPGDDGDGTDDGNQTSDPGNGNQTGPPGDGNQTGNGNGNGTGDGNQTGDGNETDAPGWPSMGSATIRPGATIGGRICTANFVFSDPSNSTLYIGTASHCVSGKSIGDDVEIANINAAGTVAYCSWKVIDGTEDCPEGTGPGNSLVRDPNDFALVEIKAKHRGQVHPALLHWGGPTGIGAPPQVGDRVLTYGNSGLRPGNALDPREGYVHSSGQVTSEMYFVPPSISGDSGSPVIRPDGQTVGVLFGGDTVPPGSNSIANLDHAVSYMEDNTDLDVELKTWRVLDSGTLP